MAAFPPWFAQPEPQIDPVTGLPLDPITGAPMPGQPDQQMMAPPATPAAVVGMPPYIGQPQPPVAAPITPPIPEIPGGGLAAEQERLMPQPVRGRAGKNAPGDQPALPPKQEQARPMTYADAVRASANAQGLAAMGLGELEAEKQKAVARGEAGKADLLKRQTYAAENRAAKRATEDANERARLEQERIGIANTNVDPDAFYNEGGASRKAVLLIGGFIGGFLGRDTFSKAVQQMVADNIDAQKANLANRRASLDAGMSLYEQTRAAHASEDAAEHLFAAAHYDAFGKMVEAEVAGLEVPIQKQKGIMAAIQIKQLGDAEMQKSFEADRQYRLEQERNAISDYSARAAAANAAENRRAGEFQRKVVFPTGLALETAKTIGEIAAAGQAAAAEREVTLLRAPDSQPIASKGKTIRMSTPESAEKENLFLSGLNDYLKKVDTYAALTEGNEREWAGLGPIPASERKAVLDSMLGEIQANYKQVMVMGAHDAHLKTLLETIVAPSASWLKGSNAAATARSHSKNMRDAYDSRLRGRGYEGSFWDDYYGRTRKGSEPGAVPEPSPRPAPRKHGSVPAPMELFEPGAVPGRGPIPLDPSSGQGTYNPPPTGEPLWRRR